MLEIRVDEEAKRLDLLVSEEPDRDRWAETVLSLAVRLQELEDKGLECCIDLSSLHAISAYSKERVFALRDLFLRHGFTKVVFQVSSVQEATRMTHKRRSAVMAGSEEYRFAA